MRAARHPSAAESEPAVVKQLKRFSLAAKFRRNDDMPVSSIDRAGDCPRPMEGQMKRILDFRGVAAIAMLAIAAPAAVMAGSPTRPVLNPTFDQPISTTPAALTTCPDPAPLFMQYSKGSVPYHPEQSFIKLVGTVKNLGGATFVPGAQPQAIELWMKWGNSGAQKVASVPLPTMAGGTVQTIQTSFEPEPYAQKLEQYGGSPKLTLLINSNAVGMGSGKDCRMGEANLQTIYGPNAGELAAMGIYP
jgi:hypothetical protein